MALTKQEFSRYIKQFAFRELFNEMGWNNDKTSQPIIVNNETYTVQAVAEKSGFKILVCSPTQAGDIPDYYTRKQLEAKVTKLFQEHLLIFCDAKKQHQIWQLAVRQSGKPTKLTETRYSIQQDPELLFQRASGIFFELAEEDKITIVDVTKRVAENFQQNNERVTKQFYERFKKEHSSFLKFINGIIDQNDKEWYASLMLNRLMFCYFIQKKGFLDKNKNYLSDKLKSCQEKKGKNTFYSFYRNFLLALFHRGLGAPEHSNQLMVEIGKVPYLNGGLFDEHHLEKNYSELEIDDKAFEKLFKFFDDWEWHLDTRIAASGKDINPDVIGYIFEKYINDRVDMGAYYTKEDITEYISKNSIIPYLFEETKRLCPKAFKEEGEIWQILERNAPEYVYEPIKKGCKIPLPKEIESGTANIEKRSEWDRPGISEFALDTETWREVIERREHYFDIQKLIKTKEFKQISSFITYNLNIRQFIEDIISETTDPELLKAFYVALSKVTIIDPTCGSGAFLFAALNILEPLYESCIQRMENFVADAPKGRHKFFEEIIRKVNAPEHPNPRYFIYKSIILNNLYGVDIMKEAVEIAKLRLFLKLVATVDADYSKPNLGLEPLPDIDFNIRSGNTLVGFGTQKQLEIGALDFQNDKERVLEQMEIVSMAFQKFKAIQLPGNYDYNDFKTAKKDYQTRLDALKHDLDRSYYNSFGNHTIKFTHWKETHLPFHWFAEFYEIIHNQGGFDVVIGNPPYLEVRQIKYEPRNLSTYSSGAVHNMCIERSLQILNDNGSISMIVPLALVCTQRMVPVQKLLENTRSTWYLNFAWRPGKLFENVNRALTIFVANSDKNKDVFTTKYIKWQSSTRELLFPTIRFISWNEQRNSFWVPKLGNVIEKNILKKVLSCNTSISHLISSNSVHRVYYRTTGGLYWKVFTNFPPLFYVKGKQAKSSRETSFTVSEKNQDILSVALLSSNIFWWWYTVTSNLRDLNPSDIQGFKFPKSVLSDSRLVELGKKYLKDIEKKSVMLTRIQKQTGETQTQSFKISQSKSIIDEIDTELAKHYKLSPSELDFIINYDIKYRMNRDSDDEE